MKRLWVFVVVIGFGLYVAHRVHQEDGAQTTAIVAASSVAASLPPANPTREAKCRDALRAVPSGVIGEYDSHGDMAKVEVGDAFYEASFSDKQLLDAMIRCVLSQGRDGDAGLEYISYLDFRTHKEVAKWSRPLGFSVN
ncbi:hypothetical protein GCM10011507_34860 [Edaphobacter acidisoli]|uniref:Uncharacterized protein n=2 Tax=Edaphobacter acidisoli TaxID=2040573 RepID=A0A916S2T3_9BACT|nr:hypothetical protein GCM10011507_34860 [Edaphobacter acidisoli]